MRFVSHRVLYSVLFYALFIVLIIVSKPPFVFDASGQLKNFGIGENKTMFSLGVFTVVLAMISYYIFAIIDVVFGVKK